MKSSGNQTAVSTGELYKNWGEPLKLESLTGRGGFNRDITSGKVIKPGAYSANEKRGQVQVLGRGELQRLGALEGDEEKEHASFLSSGGIACYIVARGFSPDPKIIKTCKDTKTPLFLSGLFTGKLITTLEQILEEALTPFTTAHGVLLEVYGTGVLLIGESGIGKSESALDLINRGSKLISDDIVEIRMSSPGKLLGRGPEHIKHLMEIRGVGIINIHDLFGKSSVMKEREIDIVIELTQWDKEGDYERLGIDAKTYEILNTELPYLHIPVSPGRNVATIIEVAARNQRLKLSGIHSAKNFSAEHTELLKKKE